MIKEVAGYVRQGLCVGIFTGLAVLAYVLLAGSLAVLAGA